MDLYYLAVKLAEDPLYDITFIVGDYGQADVELYGKVKVVKLKYGNIECKGFVKLLKLIHLIKTLFWTKADIYITESASELLGWMVLINKMIKRKPVVFRLASDVNSDLEFYKKSSQRFYHLYKFGLLRADWIISQSEYQNRCLKENLGIDSSIIKNGFFIPEGDSDPEGVCEDNQVLESKTYILWVSRCIPLKRPKLLVELARRLPEESFVLIMPSYNNEQSNRLENEILKDISQIKNLKHIKYVPFNEISKYYERAKLFVNTSEYEGFPNAFVQACLGKTPILSFKVNPDHFITENELGRVCDDRIEDAVSFIRSLNPEKVRFYGENAFKYVDAHHNIKHIIQEYKANFKMLKDSKC